MLSKSDIDNHLDSIPPIPKTLKDTLFQLNKGDMKKAAEIAATDRAFVEYLSAIVNKPIFGFREEIKNVHQIFGILGLSRSRSIVSSYYMQIMLPKRWEVFDFTNREFQDLQANLIIGWGKILNFLGIKDAEIEQSVVLIPGALIVCEMLFADIKDTIAILRATKQIGYDEILSKMSGMNLLDIVLQISKKWEFSEKINLFLREFMQDGKMDKKIIFLRLLVSYEMSKPYAIKSGLNDFFDFPMEFSEDDILKFNHIMGEMS